MAKPEKLDVKITEVAPNQCEAVPDFVAKRGSKVNFVFNDFPNADLIFTDGSPFDGERLKPGSHKVRANVPPATPPNDSVKFKYRIEWPGGGRGNGQGEVIGG